MTHHISLRKEGEAIFDMSLGNRQQRGLFVSLLTLRSPAKASVQFDDFGGNRRWQSISDAVGRIIEGKSGGEDTCLRNILDGEIVWRPDDHYTHFGQERGLIAFQKIVREGVAQLLCMVAQKDHITQDPNDNTFCMHSVIFSPVQSQEESGENPLIWTPEPEWRSLCYIANAIRRTAYDPSRGSHKHLPPLAYALKKPDTHFPMSILPENIARIQSVFGI